MYVEFALGLGNNYKTVIIILSWSHDAFTVKTFNIILLYHEPDVIINTVVFIKCIVQNIPICYLNEIFCVLCSQFQYL